MKKIKAKIKIQSPDWLLMYGERVAHIKIQDVMRKYFDVFVIRYQNKDYFIVQHENATQTQKSIVAFQEL